MKQKNNYVMEPNVNSIRQVVSGFNDPSTYKPFRASWEPLMNNDLLLPATIFKLCDLPHTEYGVSNTSAAKIGSRFMKALAVAYLSGEYSLSRSEEVVDSLRVFHANTTEVSILYLFSIFHSITAAEFKPMERTKQICEIFGIRIRI